MDVAVGGKIVRERDDVRGVGSAPAHSDPTSAGTMVVEHPSSLILLVVIVIDPVSPPRLEVIKSHPTPRPVTIVVKDALIIDVEDPIEGM